MYCVLRGEKQFTLLPPSDVLFLYEQEYPQGRYRRKDDGSGFEVHMEEGIVPWIPVGEPMLDWLQVLPLFSKIVVIFRRAVLAPFYTLHILSSPPQRVTLVFTSLWPTFFSPAREIDLHRSKNDDRYHSLSRRSSLPPSCLLSVQTRLVPTSVVTPTSSTRLLFNATSDRG